LPIEEQLRLILERQEVSGSNFRDSREKKHPEAFEDIYDGLLYKKLMEPGQFLHESNNYSYNFNTDGVPIFKSSKSSVWPIYMQVNELPPGERIKTLVLCGVWVGSTDPKMDIFLQQFVQQGKKLFNEGIIWKKNSKNICSKFVCLCCCVDSVARPLLQGTTQFNGYYGCSWCLHKGELVEGQVKYPVIEKETKSRTDRQMEKHMSAAFHSKSKVKGVKGPSPLINLPLFRIVRGFVPDYMHSICLGVVRQITNLWFEDVGKGYYIGRPALLGLINEKLVAVKPPNGIARLPRSLGERKFWKANEWKNWLLFYSVPCLRDL
jgi:hypothetical protein